MVEQDQHLSRDQLIRKLVARFLVAITVLFAMLFLPAGTFDYWEAWGYVGILLIPMCISALYWLKNAPDLLERRMRAREKERVQGLIIKITYIYFIITYLLPGLDKRYGWSDVPAFVVIFADMVVVLGYSLIFLALRINHYASHTVEVEPGQHVVSSGPYAIVRHPMYLGVGLMYALTPLALGSYWALIPAVFMIPVLTARIRNEERVLAKELKGYREYMQKIPYRLIPGIW